MNMVIKYGSQENERIELRTKNASIIGGNGSGKSSLMRRLKQQNSNFTIISAHKNLTIRQGSYRGQEYDWLTQNKDHFEGPTGNGKAPSDNNSQQIDFNQMIELALRDYIDVSVEAFNKALGTSEKAVADPGRKLDQVLNIWNSIFTDREILYKDKKIKAKIIDRDELYDIEHLSDGERVVLYVLLKLILSGDTQSIVIDEPETFLNPAILNQLFDECEKIKHNSNFLYFSHDLEFVTTRKNSTIFWIKNYSYPNNWEIVPIEAEKIPEELIVKVVGSKKQKILFVESENSKDAQLYQLIYPDFKVWAVGGCENVITYTKAFNSRTEKFNKSYFGLIDRDLKSEEQIAELEKNKIFCLPVSIYENLFLKREIVSFVFKHLGRTDFETKFPELEKEVKSKLQGTNFGIGYKKSKVQQLFNLQLDNLVKDMGEFKINFALYETEIENLRTETYDNILKSYNQKDIKGCVQKLNINWSDWHDQVLNLFNTNKSFDFRAEFMKFMPEAE